LLLIASATKPDRTLRPCAGAQCACGWLLIDASVGLWPLRGADRWRATRVSCDPENRYRGGRIGFAADPGRVVRSMNRPPEHRIRSSDAVEIAFDVAGSAQPPLVFVHGWAGRRQHWDNQLGRFAADHLVVRVDLGGHGDSGRNRQRWTISSFSDDVIAVIDSMKLEEVILIGHSLGGSVVVAAAQQLGHRVVGVIGIDTWSALGPKPRTEDVQSSILLPDMRADFITGSARFVRLMCGPTAPSQLVSRITEEVAAMPADIAIGILEGAGGGYAGELERGLRALRVPISAISSETFRPKDVATFASFGIHNVAIEGSGHYVMLERPEEFNTELAAAISRVQRT
jgi:pimeloyl-ACP methyl ester carboxylesterase